MLLSQYLRLAVSLKDLKANRPDQERFLDRAIQLGMNNKWLFWFSKQLDEADGGHPTIEELVDASKAFDKALATKRIDALIAQNKLPPQAKDVGYWQKQPFEKFEEAVESTTKTVSLSQVKKEESVSGATKLYDDGHYAAYLMDSYAAVKKLGVGTNWCITVESTYKGYRKQGYTFVFLLDREVPTNQGKPKKAIGKVALAFSKKGLVEAFDARDVSIHESDVAKHFKSWPKIKTDILSGIQHLPFASSMRFTAKLDKLRVSGDPRQLESVIQVLTNSDLHGLTTRRRDLLTGYLTILKRRDAQLIRGAAFLTKYMLEGSEDHALKCLKNLADPAFETSLKRLPALADDLLKTVLKKIAPKWKLETAEAGTAGEFSWEENHSVDWYYMYEPLQRLRKYDFIQLYLNSETAKAHVIKLEDNLSNTEYRSDGTRSRNSAVKDWCTKNGVVLR